AETLNRGLMMSHDHRRLGVEFNNRVWTLLEKPSRTPQEDQEMTHAAQASLAHWLRAGTGVNAQRRVADRARLCRALAPGAGTASSARDRAPYRHAQGVSAGLRLRIPRGVAGTCRGTCAKHACRRAALRDGKMAGESLGDEDRRIFFEQLHTGPWYGSKP